MKKILSYIYDTKESEEKYLSSFLNQKISSGDLDPSIKDKIKDVKDLEKEGISYQEFLGYILFDREVKWNIFLKDLKEKIQEGIYFVNIYEIEGTDTKNESLFVDMGWLKENIDRDAKNGYNFFSVNLYENGMIDLLGKKDRKVDRIIFYPLKEISKEELKEHIRRIYEDEVKDVKDEDLIDWLVQKYTS